MASSSTPAHPTLTRIKEECGIPADCYIDFLDPKYEGWEEKPSILPPNSLVVSEPHLQLLRFPLHPFYHYLYAVYNLHLLQIPPNSLRQITGFLCLSLVRDLRLTIDDFLYSFTRVRSSRASKFPHYHLTPRKNFVWFTGLANKDPEIKTFYLLTGNWPSVSFDRDVFPLRRGYNIGNFPSRLLDNSVLLEKNTL